MLRNTAIAVVLGLLLAGCPPPAPPDGAGDPGDAGDASASGTAAGDGTSGAATAAGDPSAIVDPAEVGKPPADAGEEAKPPPEIPVERAKQLDALAEAAETGAPPPEDGGQAVLGQGLTPPSAASAYSKDQPIAPNAPDHGTQQPVFLVSPEGNITLAGTVTYEGKTRGTLKMDFIQHPIDQQLPTVLHQMTLDKPGDWTASAPVNIGRVAIFAYIDVDDNGPSAPDPMDSAEVIIGTSDISGIDLVLKDETDRQPPRDPK